MNHSSSNPIDHLIARAGKDEAFRNRLLEDPKAVVEQELGAALSIKFEIRAHEESDTVTHLVLPPKSKRSEEEREAARTGAASLEFLKKTMYDPAPQARPSAPNPANADLGGVSGNALREVGVAGVRKGLKFLEGCIDERGAWHCVRFNLGNANIPRHYERPAFITAFCVLALEACDEPLAKAISERGKQYLVSTMEHPGLWRYYQHLPQDLDSSSLCSMLLPDHPWMLLGKNLPSILDNRDENGCFQTWVLSPDEPLVAFAFRFEADPVVNANIIAYLGNRRETRAAQRWLEKLLKTGALAGTSKWYPDEVSIHYAIARAMGRVQPDLDRLRPALCERIGALREGDGSYGNILQTAQAVSALHRIECLEPADIEPLIRRFLREQAEDGGWPELLAFGDQFRQWGDIGQIGHGSESVTTAFCVEALDRLLSAPNIPSKT